MYDKFLVLLSVAVIAVILDFATGKVSNKLILIGLLLGLCLRFYQGGLNQVGNYLLGITVPFLALIVVFLIGGIGAGDIKLFSVIGGFVGAKDVLVCIVAAIFIGAVISIIKILMNKNFFVCFSHIIQFFSGFYQTQKIQVFKKEKSNTIHFTLPILISVLLSLGGII